MAQPLRAAPPTAAPPGHPPGFFPPADAERAAVLEQIHQSPRNFGSARSRWTLDLLHELCGLLQPFRSLSGLWRRLHKWKIKLKRGRRHIHSPDPDYQKKVQHLLELRALARQNPQQVALLYADEKTVYRQPQAALAWWQAGRGGQNQALAELSCRSNTKHRLGGAMDVVSGRVLFEAASRMGVDNLCRLLERVKAAYPGHERVVVAWDNWPVHYHPKVREKAAELGIELAYLPTYAPWTNPIEKLWKWLEDEVLRMHNLADAWEELKQRTRQFLGRFAGPSPELLRYVGLLLSG